MGDRGRLMLDVLMGRRNEWATHCVYCGRDVVNIRLMPPEYAPRHIGGLDKVEFFINGRRHIALAVTADHYFDRCYGGRSTLNNILPACRPCNNMRSTGRDVPLCIDCRRNRRTRYKRCEQCHRAKIVRHEECCAFERAMGALIRSLREPRSYVQSTYTENTQSPTLGENANTHGQADRQPQVTFRPNGQSSLHAT